MRAESGREAGEQAAREMLHGLRAQAAELERDRGHSRAQAAELERDRGHWTAQLADVKEACFGQIADLRCKLDVQLQEAKVSAHACLSESKFTTSLMAEAKDALFAHVDTQISGMKEAMDKVADHVEECKNRLDLHKHSIDATLAGSRRELVGMVEDIRQATDQRVEGIQHVAVEREQQGEQMARSLMEDMTKGYQEVQSEARGETKAEAECLRRWMEAGLDAQNAHWRSVVLMLEQKQHELQDSHCELQARTCKIHEELTSDLGSGLARLASETYECERHLQDVARETHRCDRQLQDSSSEAAHQAKQVADAIHRVQSETHMRFADAMRSQDQVRQSQDQCQAEQKTEWRQLTAALQQVEERTAWLCGRADSAHDVALTDIQACRAQQESAQESAQVHRQEMQQHFFAVQEVQSALQRRQQLLEDAQCEQQQHVAQRVEVLAQDVEALGHAAAAQERLTARVAATTEREDASLAASVFAAEERQVAKHEMLKRCLEEQMSKLTAELQDCASSKQSQDEAMQELRRDQDDSVQKLRQTQDDSVQQLSDAMQELRQSQDDSVQQLRHSQDEVVGQLRHSLNLFQGEQQVIQEELQRLQECGEERNVVHEDAHHAQVDALQQARQSLKSCEEEQEAMREHFQHDFADMAEHLMSFRSSLNNTHETAEQSLLRCEQLMRGQCEFSQELGRSHLQHRELRNEQQNAAAQFVAELSASEARILTDQRSILAQVHEIGKAQEAQETRAQRCAKKCQVRHAESGEALEEVRKQIVESKKQLFGDVLSEQTVLAQNLQRQIYDAERAAVAKTEHFSEAGAQTMSENLRKELGWMRHVHDEKAKQLQDHIDFVGQKAQEAIQSQVAQVSAASAAQVRAHRDEHAASISELQEVQRANRMLSAQSHADALAEISACREACFLATQRAAAEQAALERSCAAMERSSLQRAASMQEDIERSCLERAASMREEVAAIERSCQQRAVSMQEDASVEVKTLRDQLLEQAASQEPRLLQLREAVARLGEDAASQEPRLLQLGEAVARLEEDGGPSSRIAGAAAAAASEVRDEVFREVTQIRERLEAVDDQMIFLRGEVAPDVLRSFLRPSVVQCSERAAADQLTRFRKDWGGDVEWRLDCVADCLNSLYLKVGLPTRALAVLRQDTFPT